MLPEISASEWKKIVPIDDTAILVTSPFCQACALAEKMVEEAMHFKKRTPIYKLNLQLAPKFAQEYKIQSVPMLLLFNDQKTEIKRLSPIKHTGNILHFLETYSHNER